MIIRKLIHMELDSDERFFIIAGILYILGGIIGVFPMIYEYILGASFAPVQALFMNIASAFIGVMLIIIFIDSVA